ncbi:ArnT family glycosyltransferase [Hymenobacter algoricola]|uniref:ArnT family glycosyltransferase n=1 Tax=Hymenobacter algoricola TaxID=486267 RepID=UPI0031E67E71
MQSFLKTLLTAYQKPPVKACLLLFLAAVLAWLFLHSLGKQPLQFWDESRLAINALNILVRHDWLVMYYGRYPDTLNTKPPLMPVLQALCYTVWGVSAWSHRLPAALAASLTTALLLVFSWKVLRKPWVGISAAIVLATMPGFNGTHVARTGDYDALLALMTATYCLSWYVYTQHSKRHHLLLFGLALATALLIKCSAALVPLPGLLFYTCRYHAAVLRSRRFWAVLSGAFLPLAAFYIIREVAYPGYLHFTLFYDWAGAALLPLTGPTKWWFYFPVLRQGIGAWTILALFLLASSFRAGFKPPQILLFALWQIGTLLVVGCITQTRMPWYIVHAYPMIALALGSWAVSLGSYFPRRWLVLAFATISFSAGIDVVQRHHKAAVAPLAAFQQYGQALTHLDTVALLSRRVVFVYERYNPLLEYYWLTAPPLRRLQLDFRRVDKDPESVIRTLVAGQQVAGCLPEYRRLIEHQFTTTPLAALDSCWCLRLNHLR